MLERLQHQLNESYQSQCDLVKKCQQSDTKVQELKELIQHKENLFKGREEYLQGKMSELKERIKKLHHQETKLMKQKRAAELKVESLKKSKNKYRLLYLNEITARSNLEKELASANEKSLRKQNNILNALRDITQYELETLAKKRYFNE
jgi:predicted nuclease with TOPRIM domain